MRDLADGALVYRSDHHHRKEGAFAFCSFWLVDALATAGRVGEAQERFEELLKLGNHLSLYAEEIDPATGDFLGNFPQAFTHVGLINSAVKLDALLPEQ
jgi:GH15 family glucan-1,4-alpha-glucosidase